MSSDHFSNQFDNAFAPTKLCGWEVPKETSTKAWRNQRKVTIPVVDANYRLVGERKKGRMAGGVSGFVGTWDLPKKLPSKSMDNPTGRNKSAYEELQKDYEEAKRVISGKAPLKKKKALSRGSKDPSKKNGLNQLSKQTSSNYFYEEKMAKGFMTMEGANDGCYVGAGRYGSGDAYVEAGRYGGGGDEEVCGEERYRNAGENIGVGEKIYNGVSGGENFSGVDRCGSIDRSVIVGRNSAGSVRGSVVNGENYDNHENLAEDDNRDYDFNVCHGNKGSFNYNGIDA